MPIGNISNGESGYDVRTKLNTLLDAVDPTSGKLLVGVAAGATPVGSNAVNIQPSRSSADRVASGNSAIAIGRNTKASNTDALAVGSGANVTASGGIAIGPATVAGNYGIGIGYYTNITSGSNKIAIGKATVPGTGRDTIAMGYNATNTGAYAIAIGGTSIYASNTSAAGGSVAIGGDGYTNGARATAILSTAIGTRTVASSTACVAIGAGAGATGTGAIAIGSNVYDTGNAARATGNYATAIGPGGYGFNAAFATSYYAIAIGPATLASAANSTAIGQFARTTVASTVEIGFWQGTTVRNTAIRMGGGKTAFSIPDTSSAPTDGGATLGSEAAGYLPREMITFRRNGDVILADINVAGTVKTLSIGTAT